MTEKMQHPWMRWTLILHSISLLIGFIIFLSGFLVLKTPIPGYATWDNVSLGPDSRENGNSRNFTAQFDRLVIVLIDALRADFVLPDPKSKLPQMNFVNKLVVGNKTLSFLAKAHPPTVTLPRIKALTTGGVPGFVDVVLNFDSAALQEDNLISQFNRHNKSIVFYGDDTWVRLFPGHFIRQDGTTSFFVTDFTEVDNNVTRHLDNELESNDWDVLILHYLGLDHIGHLAGPYSPLVAPKLQEMDDIVKTIYETLLEQDKKSGEASLLVLCGDHGMSEHGSHGGSSPHEVNTPFVMMSSEWAEGSGLPYKPDTPVNQVDIVPTVALLFGLPIPQNSLGSAVLPALHGLPTSHQVAALYVNAQQLSKVFMQNFDNYEKEPSHLAVKRAVAAHSSWLSDGSKEGRAEQVCNKYTAALSSMRARLSESLTRYDLHAMGYGILLLWTTGLSLLLTWLSDASTSSPFTLGRIPVAAFLTVLGFSGHVALCTGPHASQLLCQLRPSTVLLNLGVFLILLVYATQLCGIIQYVRPSSFSVKGMVNIFVLLGTIGHTLSLASSSFVEEEHQTWYLFTTTVLLLVVFNLAGDLLAKEGQAPVTETKGYTTHERVDPVSPLEREYLQIQEISALHSQCFKKAKENITLPNRNNPQIQKDNREAAENSPIPHAGHVAALVLVLVVVRIMRSWNRTGDKWSHLPDIGDWLVDGAQKRVLSVLVLLSICGITAVRWQRDVSLGMSNLLFGGTIAVYCFRAANGALELPIMYGQEAERGIIEARAVYAIIATMLVAMAMHFHRDTKDIRAILEERQPTDTTPDPTPAMRGKRRTMLIAHVQLMWTIMMLLLVRPHNIPLMCLITVLESCLTLALIPSRSLPTWVLSLLYIWMGQTCFFMQGNSNSISTVDVSAGYIGLEEYTPEVVTVLLCLATYAGPIFWAISLLKLLSKRLELGLPDSRMWRAVLTEVGTVVLSCRALPLAIYTCLATVQRYHLFVWTVFSPKLLYEGMLTVVTLLFMLLMQPLYYV